MIGWIPIEPVQLMYQVWELDDGHASLIYDVVAYCEKPLYIYHDHHMTLYIYHDHHMTALPSGWEIAYGC